MNKNVFKKFLSSILSVSLIFLSVFTILPINVNAEDNPPPPPSPNITFDIGGNASGVVQYKIGEAVEWTTIGNEGVISAEALSEGTTVYIKATPGNGAILDNHTNQNTISFGETETDIYSSIVNGGTYSFTYSAQPYSVRIRFDNATAGGGNPGGPALEVGQYEIIVQQMQETSGTVKVEFLDDSGNTIGSPITASSNTAAAAIPAGAVSVKVSMNDEASAGCLNNARLESFPRPESGSSEVDLIDDIRMSGYSTQSINPATNGYQIKIIFSNTMSVSWSYDPSAAADQYVEHARIELLRGDNATDYEEQGRTDWQLTIGETYYFVLIPDYGYQVSSLNINGQPIEPETSEGVFSFTMSHSNFHFQGIVSASEDIANYDQSGILGGLSVDGEGSVNSGNVCLTETDVDSDSNSLSAVSSSEATLLGTVNLSMDKIISKGNGYYWETPLTELASPASIRMVIPAGELEDGQTYTVVRCHNGVYEEIEAQYYIASETLVFESDKFSTFSIIKKPGTPAAGSIDNSSEGNSAQAGRDLPLLSESIGEVAIADWADFNAVVNNNPGALNKQLTELILNYKTSVVPADVFKNVSKTNAIGIHLFVGKGCALTFLNGGNIANQPQIDLSCSVSEEAGKKTVQFNNFDNLIAPVIYHSIVPAGTKKVIVYYIDADGVRSEFSIQSPSDFGRFCFAITKLGKYEMCYDVD
ncbi:MAG: hypothetical protein K6G72_13305 [Lachnospiraceae bacterium]|nr:hypothetical protein [Lachnospiraceae bacterium]